MKDKKIIAALLFISCMAIFNTGDRSVTPADRALEAPISLQEEVHELIQAQPGQYFRSTIRETNRSIGVIQYHISRLLKQGSIVAFSVANYKGYFPSSMRHLPDKKKSALIFLHANKKGDILRVLVEREKILQNELSDLLDISVQNLSYHLKGLEELGLIEREQMGLTKLISLDPEIEDLLLQFV